MAAMPPAPALNRPSAVMAGLVPAIRALLVCGRKDVDARDKRGHDDGESGSIGPGSFATHGGQSAHTGFPDRRPYWVVHYFTDFISTPSPHLRGCESP